MVLIATRRSLDRKFQPSAISSCCITNVYFLLLYQSEFSSFSKYFQVNRTHVNSAVDFFVQPFDFHTQTLEFAGKIYTHLLTPEKRRLTVAQIKPGTLCLAPYAEEYFRGEILEVFPEKRNVKIFFCDYGNIAEVDQDLLMEIPDELLAEPRQVSHCRWDMGLTNELSETKKLNAFADDTQALIASHKVSCELLLGLANCVFFCLKLRAGKTRVLP